MKLLPIIFLLAMATSAHAGGCYMAYNSACEPVPGTLKYTIDGNTLHAQAEFTCLITTRDLPEGSIRQILIKRTRHVDRPNAILFLDVFHVDDPDQDYFGFWCW
jgi:hypothetical protein